jgi:hypothetical protein
MRHERDTDTARIKWLESTRSQVGWVRESLVGFWVVSSDDGDTLAKDKYSIRSAIDSAMRAASVNRGNSFVDTEGRIMIHSQPHPLSGQTVTIRSGSFKGFQYRLEDWWD